MGNEIGIHNMNMQVVGKQRGNTMFTAERLHSDNDGISSRFKVGRFAKYNRGLTIKSGDLDHGYVQGEKLSNPLVLRQPTCGCAGTVVSRR